MTILTSGFQAADHPLLKPLLDLELVDTRMKDTALNRDFAKTLQVLLPGRVVIIDAVYSPAELVQLFARATHGVWHPEQVLFNDDVPGVKRLTVNGGTAPFSWRFTGWNDEPGLQRDIIERLVEHAESELPGEYVVIPGSEHEAYLYLDKAHAREVKKCWEDFRQEAADGLLQNPELLHWRRLLKQALEQGDMNCADSAWRALKTQIAVCAGDLRNAAIAACLPELLDMARLAHVGGKRYEPYIDYYREWTAEISFPLEYSRQLELARFYKDAGNQEESARILIEVMGRFNSLPDDHQKAIACIGLFAAVAKLEYYPIAEKLFRMAGSAVEHVESPGLRNTLRMGLDGQYQKLIPESVRSRLDVSYDRNPEHQMFSAGQIALSAFFGTALVAVFMMFKNYMVLGHERQRKYLIRLSLLASPGIVYLYTLGLKPAILYNLGTAVLAFAAASYLQGPLIREYKRTGGELARWYTCVIYVVLCLLLIFAGLLIWELF